MNRADTVRGVLVWEQVAEAARAKAAHFREQLNADAHAEFTEQGTVPTWRLPDIGTVTLPVSIETPYVADLDALTKWVEANYPQEVVVVAQVRGAFVGALLARVEVEGGQAVDTTTGVVVPGLGVRAGGQPRALTIRPAGPAKVVIRAAADELVERFESALTGGQPDPVPAPVAAVRTPGAFLGPAPTGDATGGWRAPTIAEATEDVWPEVAPVPQGDA